MIAGWRCQRADGSLGWARRSALTHRERDSYRRAARDAGRRADDTRRRARYSRCAALPDRSPAAPRASASNGVPRRRPAPPTTRPRRFARAAACLVTLAEPLGPGGIEPLLAAMRAALVRHGLAVAAGDRYRILRPEHRSPARDARAISTRLRTGRRPRRALMARYASRTAHRGGRGGDLHGDARCRLLWHSAQSPRPPAL